jgi:hypothetical protein
MFYHKEHDEGAMVTKIFLRAHSADLANLVVK